MSRIILGFIPWFLYPTLINFFHLAPDAAIFITLLFALGPNYRELKNRFLIPWIGLIFFLIWLVLINIYNPSLLNLYFGVVSNSILSMIAFGSLIVAKPFTLQYAHQKQSKEKWNDPTFIFINKLLTFIWGTVFLFNLAINLLKVNGNIANPLTPLILTASSVILGVLAGSFFPKLIINLKNAETNDRQF